MSLVFPLPFDGDAPAIVILDGNGNTLDDSLDENTYATFGTIPKDGSSTLTLYVKNTGATPIYSVKCEGIASSHQLGTAANTYEALGLPQELGNINSRETIELEVVWTVPTECPTGMKIFGLKVTDSTYLALSENHDYFVKITVTNNDTDLLLDFPIEINFTVGSIDWTKTTSDGRDLRFYDEDFNELQHYIETWTPGTTTGKVWVRIDTLSSGQSLYIYLGYGNDNLFSTSNPNGKYELYEDFQNGFRQSWIHTGAMTYTINKNLSLDGGGTINDGLWYIFDKPLKNYVFEIIANATASSLPKVRISGLCYPNLPAMSTGTTTAFVYNYGVGGLPANYKLYINGYQASTVTVPYFTAKVTVINSVVTPYYPATTARTATVPYAELQSLLISAYDGTPAGFIIYILGVYKTVPIAPTATFADVADITAEFINPDVDSGIVCVIGNVVRQLAFHDYDFKKIIYEVGYNNAYWRVPGGSGIYVWGKLEMRPLYGADVSFVDNLYANDAYFYTFTDYGYDVHDKLVVEGVIYDIQAIQVHDAGSETIYKTLVLKRQPEYYACCVGVVS